MDPSLSSSARGLLPAGAIYADWAASALPLPWPSASVPPPAHAAGAASALPPARRALQVFLGDSADAYHVIFTAGATAALHLLAHRLPWTPADLFVAHPHVHNAVLGIRNPARAAGAAFRSVSTHEMPAAVRAGVAPNHAPPPAFALLAYPAQCNLTGATYPFEWARSAKEQGLFSYPPERVITLVDTAKLAASAPLILDDHAEYLDALVFSLYKLSATFTGLGALLVRKHSLLESLLMSTAHVSYFAGGLSVDAVSPFSSSLFEPPRDLVRQLELGTPNMQAIYHLPAHLRYFSPPGKIMPAIRDHANALAALFVNLITTAFSSRLVQIHRDHFLPEDQRAGTIVAFTLYREEGHPQTCRPIGHNEVGTILKLNNVYARAGCMCNTGACCSVLGLSDADVARNFARGHRCGDDMDLVDGKPTGVVRVSFGWGSRAADVHAICRILRNHVSCYVYRPIAHSVSQGDVTCLFTVKSLYVYPVKSCAGTRVEEIVFDQAGGPVGDRCFAIEDTSTRALLSMRTCPVLANLTASFCSDGTRLLLDFNGENVLPGMCRRKEINLDHDGFQPQAKSVSATAAGDGQFSLRRLESARRPAIGESEIAQWLSTLTGRQVRLVRLTSPCSDATACDTGNDVLIVSEEEMIELQLASGITELEIVSEALRPNIVLSSASKSGSKKPPQHPPMNVFKSLNAGGLRFDAKRSCTRCTVVNIIAAARGVNSQGEPMRSIAAINRRRHQKGLVFGLIARAVLDSKQRSSPEDNQNSTSIARAQDITGML